MWLIGLTGGIASGTGGWKKVVETFGNDILLEDGEIDRAWLGKIVFSDPTKCYKAIVLDIPLFFEAKLDKWTKPIIVVWVDPETQLERLMARDAISAEFARNKIVAQTALDWKKTKADVVIDNSRTRDDTKAQFEEVLNEVTRPLNWKEACQSRKGMTWILVSGFIGALILRKHLC